MRSGKGRLEPVWKALDEAEFGPRNILNLRESLPSVADARHRAEAWLRERQIGRAGEVLLITGRGNRSPGGVSEVRGAILSLLAVLRRKGVVAEWREHSPGSFVVKPAKISELLDAPRRKRDPARQSDALDPQSLKALDGSTLALLRRLAVRSLEALGVRDIDKFVETEMLSKFQSLAGGIPAGLDGEVRLRDAIVAALEQLDE
ncbi:MAG TPA: hypothetical protein VGG76_09340 [Gemmatimonadaceae bacterium]|jgi:hypothetical protein